MTFNTQGPSESDLGKDANVLIMELNKGFYYVWVLHVFLGFQSTNLGIQCKTIAQFPSVLEKYPFPVVINSILLKITQIFCDGNNYLRLCILRACTECRTHFKKLTVCEDIIRKLLPFTESNDPTVRALTLRLFGILNEITRDHLGVHHAILKQIESHYEVESDAAVWASHTVAPISSVFAASLCPILCKILNNLSVDMDTKLKLLCLGKHMHHNSVVAEEIRHCLTAMLETYNTTDFVTGILDTLTVLETRAPLHVHVQINLLIKRLSFDQRPQLRQSVLWNLLTLAENVSHHFEKSHILKLSSLYHGENCSKMDKSLILQIFYCLTTSFHSVEFLTLPSGKESNSVSYYTPVDCIKSALKDASSAYLLVHAIQLACKLTILKGESDQLKYTDDKIGEICIDDDNIEFQFKPGQLIQLLLHHFSTPNNEEGGDISKQKPLWYLYDSQIPVDDLKCIYNLLVEFFSTFPSYASQLHKMNFLEGIKLDGAISTGLLCQFLCTMHAKLSQFLFLNPSITTVDNDMKSVQLNYSNVLSKLTNSIHENGLSPSSFTSTQDCVTSVLATVGLVFQLTGGSPLTQREQTILMHSVAKCLGEKISSSNTSIGSSGYRLSPWIVYQLARQGNRYGQHEFAGKLYEKLSSLAITEKSYFWLTALSEFSQMECKLINLTRNLEIDVQQTMSTSNSPIDQPTQPTVLTKKPWIAKLILGLRTASEEACKLQTTIMCVGGSDGRWFQAKYIQIRSLLLINLSNLCSTAYHALRIKRWCGSIFMNQSCRTDSSQFQTAQCVSTNNNNDSGTLPNNINHHNKVGESLVNTNDNLDNDQLDASIHGTLPRARSKRTKLPSESTVLRSSSNCINGGNRSSNNNGTNGQSECLPPKATPETSDDVDSQAIPANTNDTNEVFKATLCKASVPKNDQESVNTSSNLYDNLPRPPRRSSRLPGAINVLPLPARSHKQKDLHNSANIETPLNTNDTQFSTDTLDNLIRLNSKHIKAQSSLGSLTLSSTSPTSATTTTSPGVSPHTTSNESSSMLTPSTISSPSPSSSSSSPSVSLAFMSKKVVTPTCLSQPSLAPSNRLQLYSRNNENNNTAASSSLSSINFIDSSEIKSTDGCSSIQTSPSTIKTTMTTATPMTTMTQILTTSSPSSNSVVKSLIQSYTSISSNNSNYNANNYSVDNNLTNKPRNSPLFVPVTTTTTTTTTISSSSKSPASISFSSAVKTTPTNDYNNNDESKTGNHNSTNKLSNLGGKMRVPSSMISQSDITDPQQQKQQLPSNFSHFTNFKSSSASLFLSGPHPTSKQQHTNVTSNSSSSSSCTLSTCSPTTNNNIVKPISLPVKRDSVFRAEKTIPRRSLEANNNATIHNNNNNNESIQSPINTSVLNSNNKIRVTKDDSRRYLSELDSVIKELCEANEAAVQATREAAQRRQYLGWSSTTNSQLKLTSTNEPNILPIPSSTNA